MGFGITPTGSAPMAEMSEHRPYPSRLPTVAPIGLAPRRGSLLAVAADGRTYRNLGYLLLALPLGLAYFLFLATGFALGTGLALTLVGPPVLVAVAAGSWRLAAFERRLAAVLLGEAVASGEASPAPGLLVALAATWRDRAALVALWRGVGARLADPTTFRGLIFLVAKLPLGIVSFAIVAAAYGAAAAMLLAPVTYRFDAVVTRLGPVRIDDVEEAAVGFLLAPLALLAAMHLSNALAVASGRFARLMLGPAT